MCFIYWFVCTALPKKALEDEKSIDFVFTNEAVYALKNILNLNNFSTNELEKIKELLLEMVKNKDKWPGENCS